MARWLVGFLVSLHLAAMAVGTAPAMAEELGGEYSAQGADADGRAYAGDVRIQALGSATQAVLWRLESGEAYKGLGLIADGVLGAAYGPADAQFGIVVYRVSGGTLDGLWTLPRFAKEPAGREVLEGSPDLDGDYRITLGENPDGTTNYTGKVRIKRQGDVYLFAWFVPVQIPAPLASACVRAMCWRSPTAPASSSWAPSPTRSAPTSSTACGQAGGPNWAGRP
jgi:hypothetical protein